MQIKAKIKLLLIIISFFPIKEAYPTILSKNAEISLLTCGPGEELYSIFGHSAFRVFDVKNNIDRVYNYGTFNFETDYFYIKFASGRLLYYLDTEDFMSFASSYIYEDRTIYEQFLNLDSITRQKLYDMLEENNKTENRFYRYDFFYDNCTTRIRDLMLKTFNGKLDFKNYNPPPVPTFRNMISEYIQHQQWTDLGINLIFGLTADKKMTKSEYMFLPDELMKAFDKATINGDSIRLVKKTKILYTSSKTTPAVINIMSPLYVFWLLFAILLFISLYEIAKKRNLWLFDFLIFFSTGTLGLVVLTLFLGSAFVAVQNNLVLLWAIPFHFIMAFFVKRKRSVFVKNYYLIIFIMMLLLLGCWYFIPQEFNFAVLPVVLILAIRSFKLYYLFATAKTKRTNIYYR